MVRKTKSYCHGTKEAEDILLCKERKNHADKERSKDQIRRSDPTLSPVEKARKPREAPFVSSAHWGLNLARLKQHQFELIGLIQPEYQRVCSEFALKTPAILLFRVTSEERNPSESLHKPVNPS